MSPALQQEGEELKQKLQNVPINILEKELQKQVLEKLSGCLASIPALCMELYKYQRSAHTRAPKIWQEGSSCLYEYAINIGMEKAKKHSGNSAMTNSYFPVLVIPSLINRHYILDLEEKNSFVQYLANQGVDTYLAAWDEPQEDELGFALDHYISRIMKMIDVVYSRTGRRVVLTGYCMGGLLSLAAAQGKADKLQAIAFLATPWDFHSHDFPRFIMGGKEISKAEEFIHNYNKIPASFVQSLFYYLQAHIIGHKFEILPYANVLTKPKDGLMAIENWVNDGISMTTAVAKECFIGWVNDNKVAKLKWESHGATVNPEKLSYLPAFLAIPKKDSIVPSSCAYGLTDYFEDCKIIKPNAGHIGMIAGKAAQTQTWEPFLAWLERLSKDCVI